MASALHMKAERIVMIMHIQWHVFRRVYLLRIGPSAFISKKLNIYETSTEEVKTDEGHLLLHELKQISFGLFFSLTAQLQRQATKK